MMKKKIKSPVLFDTNILINFKAQLKFLFSFFEIILIHKQVIQEVLDESIKNELDAAMRECNDIRIVDDKTIEDYIERSLFEKCDKELKDTFNIKNNRDLGEYKTLLYAKFNEVKLLSSEDTTVWRFVTESTYFNDLECITIQDLSYLIYLNANNKRDRRTAQSLYDYFGRNEHSFESFKVYMERNNNEIPKYIQFENNRIYNYEELLKGYVEFYSKDEVGAREEIEKDIIYAARINENTCVDCLYSRINKCSIDFNIRICSLGYDLFDYNCFKVREKFYGSVRKRVKS